MVFGPLTVVDNAGASRPGIAHAIFYCSSGPSQGEPLIISDASVDDTGVVFLAGMDRSLSDETGYARARATQHQ